MKLNRTPNPLNRNTRNSDNENWEIIENNFKKIEKSISALVIESGGSSDIEVVQARGGYLVLNDRLNAIDDSIQSIGDMSPKGSFDTLDDLKTEYPNGANGIYIIKDLNAWYFWDGATWTEGGIFTVQVLDDYLTTHDKEWVI